MNNVIRLDYNKHVIWVDNIKFKVITGAIGSGIAELCVEYKDKKDDMVDKYVCIKYDVHDKTNYEIIWDYSLERATKKSNADIFIGTLRNGKKLIRERDGFYLTENGGHDTLEEREYVNSVINNCASEFIDNLELIMADILIGG